VWTVVCVGFGDFLTDYLQPSEMTNSDIYSRLGTIEGKMDMMLEAQKEAVAFRHTLDKRIGALESAWAKATGIIAVVAFGLPHAGKLLRVVFP
jgi:hypothetical protein